MIDRIINTYDQCAAAGGDRIVIFRQTQITGRGYQSPAWQVARYKNGQSIVTDPDTTWYNYGKKTFSLSSLNQKKGEAIGVFRARILAEAIAWANAKYGEREFVKNRMGDYVEREVNEKFPIPKREK